MDLARRILGSAAVAGPIITFVMLGWASSPALAQQPPPAQQITGVPGSPSATTTIDGEQLPPPPPKFGGKIERNAPQSKPYWPARVVPPKGAPNVLLIMTDDVGFGAPSTFGGVIPTPALDRIANSGLRYTNFHSTALCSPTRAALITGRNHHSAGFGVISEQATGYPGYDSIITKDKATIGRILKDNGYRTSWFGKNHNTPAFQASQVGPFDQWPIGMGFEYFYGFMGGDTNQWQPANLARNTTYIYPFVGNPGCNLTTAMADEAIGYMNRVNTLTPDQPFFVYYVPGGTHAPHHPTPEWIKKISNMHLFDKGWNELREQIFANQKKLGVIPQDAKLTPWPDDLLKEWDALSADEKKMFIRQVDVYRRLSGVHRPRDRPRDPGRRGHGQARQHADHLHQRRQRRQRRGHAGRHAERSRHVQRRRGPGRGPAQVLLRRLGIRQDLQPHGGAVDLGVRHAVLVDQADRLALRRHRARHGDLVAEGDQGQGRHPPPVPPRDRHRADDPGSDRHPAARDRRRHQAEARSRASAWPTPSTRRTPTRRRGTRRSTSRCSATTRSTTTVGSRARRSCGRPGMRWAASSQDPSVPVGALRSHARTGRSPTTSPTRPGEAQRDAGPVLGGGEEVPGAAARCLGGDAPGRAAPQHHRRPQRVHLDRRSQARPTAMRRAFSTRRTTSRPTSRSRRRRRGNAVTQGGRFGGYGFYLLKGKPVFTWNLVDLKRIKWEGPEALTPGKHTLEFDFKYDGLGMGTLAFNNMSGIGRGGTGVLKVDGKEVATQKMEHTLPADPAVGREPRHRLRHRAAGGRRGLPDAVQVHRQAQQDDAEDRPAEAHAGGQEEADRRSGTTRRASSGSGIRPATRRTLTGQLRGGRQVAPPVVD